MEHFTYRTQGTCSSRVSFDLDGNKVHGIHFDGGCDGNLKALSKVLEGWTVEDIESRLKGNTCGFKSTSCADQLAKAVRKAYGEKTYKFYGWKTADVPPVGGSYKGIKNPRDMYDVLLKCWSMETCAPRLRDKWSTENYTEGQCSISSFLIQDIFGGRVYGVPLPDGGFHCFNEVNGCVFDLTSEQFGDEKLVYDFEHEQLREEHFASEEKKARYELLKKKFEEALTEA